jgi:hypothetical protein
MASNITYPESSCLWFVEGDSFCLITNINSSGTANTIARKNWKAIQETVTDGILLYYYAEPNNVSSLSDVPDIDNSLHLALVDYIKRCLYMDSAGLVADPNASVVGINMSMMHQKRWDEAVKRFGMRKRDKTGGSRLVVPSNFR